MSTIKVDSIKSSDGNTDLLTLSNGSVSGVNFGRRNLIINGAMQVAQRGTSFTHSDTYWTDRWHRSWSLNGALDIEQSTDAPVGFDKSLKVTVDTTSTDNFNGTEYFAVGQYIEKKDIQQLAYGTSSAKAITVSFWVKASSTATYSVGLRAKFGSAGTDYYTASRSFTINSTNTWEYKTLTFSGNQTDYVNWDWGDDYGIAVNFALSVGDTIGNTYDDGEWHTGNGFGLTSATTGSNFATLSSGETIQFTGVQLEVGSVATPFEHRSYGEELALCQRYYQNLVSPQLDMSHADDTYFATGHGYLSTQVEFVYQYLCPMRVAPTLITSIAANSLTVSNGATSRTVSDINFYRPTNVSGLFYENSSVSGLTIGASYRILSDDGSNVIAFDAEL
jgi:hypothetical protein